MESIKKLDFYFSRIEEILVIIAYSAIILFISFNILFRNLFGISFQFILEGAPILVLWLSLLGSTLALKRQKHIKLELLLTFVAPKYKSYAFIATNLFGVVVMGILCYASFDFVINEVSIFGIRGWTSIIFPLFFSLCSFRYGMRFFFSFNQSNYDHLAPSSSNTKNEDRLSP